MKVLIFALFLSLAVLVRARSLQDCKFVCLEYETVLSFISLSYYFCTVCYDLHLKMKTYYKYICRPWTHFKNISNFSELFHMAQGFLSTWGLFIIYKGVGTEEKCFLVQKIFLPN